MTKAERATHEVLHKLRAKDPVSESELIDGIWAVLSTWGVQKIQAETACTWIREMAKPLVAKQRKRQEASTKRVLGVRIKGGEEAETLCLACWGDPDHEDVTHKLYSGSHICFHCDRTLADSLREEQELAEEARKQ